MIKKVKKTGLKLFAAVAVLSALTGLAMAAGNAEHPKDEAWSFEGVTGTYDRASLQRGFHVYKDVCAACHGLKYMAFRTLEDIGFSEAEVKAIAAGYQILDGPNAEGEMENRNGMPRDYMPSPYANDNEARMINGGALPPDLSLIIKARANGADYLYSILTGYQDAPEDFELTPGMSYNPYFANGQIAMPQPIFEGFVEYADGTEATVDQMSRDVVTFLAWVAEPKLEARHEMGFKFFAIMILLTVLLYFSNKKVWAGLKEDKEE